MSDEESPTTTARGDESDLTLSTTTTTATGGLPPAPEESILLDPPSRTSAPVLTSESLSLPTATATPATGIIREGREGELVTRTLEDDASTGSGSYHSLLPQDQQEEDAYQQIQNDGLGVRESIEEELSLEGMDPFYVPSARARSISLDQHPPLRAVDEELDLLQLHETVPSQTEESATDILQPGPSSSPARRAVFAAHEASSQSSLSSVSHRRRQVHTRRTAAPSSVSSSSVSSSRNTPSLSVQSGGNSNRQQQVTDGQSRQQLQPHRGLRASLDAGMAAMRRWIRSNNTESTQAPSRSQLTPRSTPHRSTASSSRSSSSRQRQPRLDSTEESTISLGEEDLFFLNLQGNRDEPRWPYHPTTILEEDNNNHALDTPENSRIRQRTRSEPDSFHIRDYFFRRGQGQRSSQSRPHSQSTGEAVSTPSRSMRRRRRQYPPQQRGRAHSDLSSSAAAALYTSMSGSATGVSLVDPATITTLDLISSVPNSNLPPAHNVSSVDAPSNGAVGVERSLTTGATTFSISGGGTPSQELGTGSTVAGARGAPEETGEVDPEREARRVWMRINRRFQFVITLVALLFSLLLFSMLICWVVLTSTYVVSLDKPCDVPLKSYYWLVTLQLVMDVFRSDILRCVFRWDSNTGDSIPCRVVAYNIAYLVYAILVLRLGVISVFVNREETACRDTAAELFNASTAFVSFSIAAWATIIFGYVLPLFVVAALLTYNGYNPASSSLDAENGATNPVFPAAYSRNGAPPACIELMETVTMDGNQSSDLPRECCICMEEFSPSESVVKTACNHVFHKSCCREWLRQARTCPVCRADIPSTIENLQEEEEDFGTGAVSGSQPRIPVGPTGRPVQGLLQYLQRNGNSQATAAPSRSRPSATIESRRRTVVPASGVEMDLEEGRRHSRSAGLGSVGGL